MHEFATISLELADSEVIEFNLAQLFQCLRTDSKEKVFRFLMRVARKSRLLCHKTLWMAKVEGIIDANSKRKVPLPCPKDELPAIVGQLAAVITGRMSDEDRVIYNEQTEFFQKITEISGALKAKEQTKPEKKAIIQKYLEKYNKELESRDPDKAPLYLITNPHYKIARIQTDSGLPMQSAERCPIMVTFWVTKYEGPDRKLSKNNDCITERHASLIVVPKIRSPEIRVSDSKEVNHVDDIHIDIKDRKASTPMEEKKRKTSINSPSLISKFQASMLESPTSPVENRIRREEGSKTKEFQPNKALFLSSGALRKPTIKERDEEKPVSCIFKAKDDVRQDTLSLQVIRIFQEIFRKNGLDLFLYPYSTVSNRTGEVTTLIFT